MKSAYELAMERLQKEDPDGVQHLSDEQRQALAEVDKKHKAKMAERELFLNKQLDEALRNGKADDAEQIHRQLSDARVRLEEEKEAEKDRIRQAEQGK